MEETIVLRLPWSWAGMGAACLLMGGGVAAVMAYDGWLGFSPAMAACVLLLAAGGFSLWGGFRFRVVAGGDEVAYTPIFGRTRRFAWPQLTRVAWREFKRIEVCEVYAGEAKAFDITSDYRNYQLFVDLLREKGMLK